MNIFKNSHNVFMKLDWPSKIIVNLMLLAFFISVGESIYAFYDYNKINVISGNYAGLPTYSGPCPALVSKAYDIFNQENIFEQTPTVSLELDKKNFHLIRNQMINLFQLSQFCEDPEAQGRVLYIAASIELVGANKNIIPSAKALYAVSSFYSQAEILGYNKAHPDESLWLRKRIERNAHKFNYVLTLPTPNPITTVTGLTNP